MEEEFTPKYQPSLVEQVADYLVKAIVEKRITGGQRLAENELRRTFGISRAPIREAFRILEKDGFLVTFPRKGTFVRKSTRKSVEEYFPVRAALEGLAAQLAVSHLGDGDIEEMEAACAKMEKAIAKADFRDYLKAHDRFHKVFITAGKSDTLINMINNFGRLAPFFFSQEAYVRQTFDYAISSHRRILDAFIKRDGREAETIVKEHILKVGDWFSEFSSSENGK